MQRLAAPLAQGDDLEKLKEMLDEVAYAYTQKELQKASPVSLLFACCRLSPFTT